MKNWKVKVVNFPLSLESARDTVSCYCLFMPESHAALFVYIEPVARWGLDAEAMWAVTSIVISEALYGCCVGKMLIFPRNIFPPFNAPYCTTRKLNEIWIDFLERWRFAINTCLLQFEFLRSKLLWILHPRSNLCRWYSNAKDCEEVKMEITNCILSA